MPDPAYEAFHSLSCPICFGNCDTRPGPTDASWCEECQTSDDPCQCELIDGSGAGGSMGE